MKTLSSTVFCFSNVNVDLYST